MMHPDFKGSRDPFTGQMTVRGCSLFCEFHGYIVWADGSITGKNGALMKPFKVVSRSGKIYMKVTLQINKKRKNFFVHRLVAECLIGPITGYEIDHKWRDTTKNSVEDLEIVTPSENQKRWRKTA